MKKTILLTLPFLFIVVACHKVEEVTDYTLSINKTEFFYYGDDVTDTIQVTKSPRGITVFHIVSNENVLLYPSDYEEFLTIIEENQKEIIFLVTRSDILFGIAVHLLAEGIVQQTDTAWFRGRYNFNFNDKIFYLAEEVIDGWDEDVIQYYDLVEEKETNLKMAEYDLLDINSHKGLIAQETNSGYIIEDLFGNRFSSDDSPFFLDFYNDSGDFITSTAIYEIAEGLTYNVTANDTLQKYISKYREIDIRVNNNDTIILYYDRSFWSTNKVMLYYNGITAEIGSYSDEAEIYSISISDDGTAAYYAVGDSYINLYRLELSQPFSAEMIYEDVCVYKLCSSPDGKAVALNCYGGLNIFYYESKSMSQINGNLNTYSAVIWK